MLNKVVVFAIFGPKCIFDVSTHCNLSIDVTWSTLMMDKDSIPYTHVQWRDRKLSD